MEAQHPRLTKPYKGADVLHISQGFHSGHMALDWVFGYGTPLVAPERVRIIENVCDCSIADGVPGLERGFGVRMLGLETGMKHLYWHIWPHAPYWKGDVVERGKIVGFMGNSGYVLTGGHYVPLPERNSSPYKGTHLHQVLWSEKKVQLNPLLHVDLHAEPTYSLADLIDAYTRTLAKAAKLAFR